MKRVLTFLAIVFSLGLIVASTPAFALTCPSGTINAGKTKKSLAECDITISDNEAKRVTTKVENAINLVLGFVGLAAVIVIIIGGIGFVTSQGDAGKAVKARTTIIYGVVGLVICLLAYAIVNLVLVGVFAD